MCRKPLKDQTTFAGAHEPHAHSSQEGYGSERQPGGQGEDQGVQSQHSKVAQQPTSQQPQEQQYRSLTGDSTCDMACVAHVGALVLYLCHAHCIQACALI